MCGIAGFFSQLTIAPETAARMMAALKNRGPDAQHSTRWNADWSRVAEDAPATNALIHARLSIIDPRPISDQPMSNAAGDIWICYNGEVYDWAEHAKELVALGAVFKTRSDTEFILHAYEKWGLDMLPRLRGMFAIAILDLRIKKLFLIRDRMGLKPMVFSSLNGNFAFGSTVRAVLPFLPIDQRQWNPHSIDAYLAHRYIPAPRTVFANIERLPNAHWLQFDLQTRETKIERYWQVPEDVSNTLIAEEEWLDTLNRATMMRTVADRPLGVFLSSGIDSSTVAARLAANMSANDKAKLQSFTAGFDRPDMDESALAKTIADTLGFPNLNIPIPSKIRDDIDRIIEDLDEPFADPSSIPTWYLARETTQHVKVVLGGEGGDEMLAGYKRFDKHLKSSWRRTMLGGTNIMPRLGDIAGDGVSKLVDEMRLDWWQSYSLRFSGFTPTQRVALQPVLKGKTPVYWRCLEKNSLRTSASIGELLAIDRENYLPEYILRKADLCTMAHGLELRAPLLDHEWVMLVSRMPASQRFTKPPKQLFKAAMTELKSLDLFAQKKKGFNPPLTTWLEQDLLDRLNAMPDALESVTDKQISASACMELLRLYRKGNHHYAEQLLQLLFLQISLTQLDQLRRAP
jgi:asparagine synthase (glutamine-hydrolysing)